MLIPFETNKVIQASAVLLKLHAQRMSRLRLLKLLYIADREILQATGRPITGDHVMAMRNGPVLSQTYGLIRGEDYGSPQWEQFIRREGPQDVVLAAEPGVGRLARHEIGKLTEVAERFRDFDDWAVAEHTHTFPEWLKNKPQDDNRVRIPLDDVLEAVGLADRKAALLADAEAEASVDRLLAEAGGQ